MQYNAILVDPFACNVREVVVEKSRLLADVYSLLSHETNPVDCIDFAQLSATESVAVDDSGMLKNLRRWFLFLDRGNPLAGKGLILGNTTGGATCSTKLTARAVAARVVFLESVGAGGFVRVVHRWEKPDGKSTV